MTSAHDGAATIAIRGLVTCDEIGSDEEPQCPDGTEARDVFIVEGAQARYGSKATWNLG